MAKQHKESLQYLRKENSSTVLIQMEPKYLTPNGGEKHTVYATRQNSNGESVSKKIICCILIANALYYYYL